MPRHRRGWKSTVLLGVVGVVHAASAQTPSRAATSAGGVLAACGGLGPQATGGVADTAGLIRELEECSDAVASHPDSAQLWLGLGEVRLRLAQQRKRARPGPLQPIGATYAQGAVRAFIRALTLEPDLGPAADGLATGISIYPGERNDPEAVRALRATTASGGRLRTDVLLVRAVVERAMGSRDSVLPILHRYLSQGGDSAVGLLALSRELYRRQAPSRALHDYLRGAGSIRSQFGRARYRRNIAWVADSAELAAFDSLPDDSLGAWIAAFWSRRDVADGRGEGARLEEHFRRIEYAERNFAVQRPVTGRPRVMSGCAAGDRQNAAAVADPTAGSEQGRADAALALQASRPWVTAPPFGEQLDDRGRIYIRHGPPDRRAIDPTSCANESWLYARSKGNLIFHFMHADFSGSSGATTLVPDLGTNAGLLDSRCGLDPHFCLLAAKARTHMLHPEEVLRERDRGLRTIARGLTTDDDPLHFAAVLDPVIQIYGVATPGGRAPATVIVAFAVPGAELLPDTNPARPGEAVYPLRIRLTAGTPSGRQRFDLDTVRVFVAPALLGKGQFLSGAVQLPVPPGIYDVRLSISEADTVSASRPGHDPGTDALRGAAVGLDSVSLPDAFSGHLALSDLIIGRERSGLDWTPPGGAPVPLNPLNAYPPGGTIALYYQMSGLTAGAQYRTRVALAPADDEKQRAVVSLTFTDRARNGYQEVRRSVDLVRLKPGHYRLTVTVRGPDGTEASRSGTVNVVKE